jgi:hypothetical protein
MEGQHHLLTVLLDAPATHAFTPHAVALAVEGSSRRDMSDRRWNRLIVSKGLID